MPFIFFCLNPISQGIFHFSPRIKRVLQRAFRTSDEGISNWANSNYIKAQNVCIQRSNLYRIEKYGQIVLIHSILMNYNGPIRVCPYIPHMLHFDVDFLSPINFLISLMSKKKKITKMVGQINFGIIFD